MTDDHNACVGENIQAGYDAFYTDRLTRWRELGGKYKAENILTLCRGRQFSRVLECGAGEGSILSVLDAAGVFAELSALEISDSGIEAIKKRNLARVREVVKFDGYRIPYPDDSFDMVYCSHVLEHVEHPRLLLRELKRVGRFQVFEVPLDYSPTIDGKVQEFLSYGHINIFTPALFKFLLKSEGFEILDEVLTEMSDEVQRFNWYENMHLKKTVAREMKLMLRPLERMWKRCRYGSNRHKECWFSAYACLTTGTGELKVL